MIYKTTAELLAAVSAGKVEHVDIAKHLEAMEKAKEKPLTCKESEKTPGVLSAYGLGQFPVSMKAKKWLRFLTTDEGKKLQKEIIALAKSIGVSDDDGDEKPGDENKAA